MIVDTMPPLHDAASALSHSSNNAASCSFGLNALCDAATALNSSPEHSAAPTPVVPDVTSVPALPPAAAAAAPPRMPIAERAGSTAHQAMAPAAILQQQPQQAPLMAPTFPSFVQPLANTHTPSLPMPSEFPTMPPFPHGCYDRFAFDASQQFYHSQQMQQHAAFASAYPPHLPMPPHFMPSPFEFDPFYGSFPPTMHMGYHFAMMGANCSPMPPLPPVILHSNPVTASHAPSFASNAPVHATTPSTAKMAASCKPNHPLPPTSKLMPSTRQTQRAPRVSVAKNPAKPVAKQPLPAVQTQVFSQAFMAVLAEARGLTTNERSRKNKAAVKKQLPASNKARRLNQPVPAAVATVTFSEGSSSSDSVVTSSSLPAISVVSKADALSLSPTSTLFPRFQDSALTSVKLLSSFPVFPPSPPTLTRSSLSNDGFDLDLNYSPSTTQSSSSTTTVSNSTRRTFRREHSHSESSDDEEEHQSGRSLAAQMQQQLREREQERAAVSSPSSSPLTANCPSPSSLPSFSTSMSSSASMTNIGSPLLALSFSGSVVGESGSTSPSATLFPPKHAASSSSSAAVSSSSSSASVLTSTSSPTLASKSTHLDVDIETAPLILSRLSSESTTPSPSMHERRSLPLVGPSVIDNIFFRPVAVSASFGSSALLTVSSTSSHLSHQLLSAPRQIGIRAAPEFALLSQKKKASSSDDFELSTLPAQEELAPTLSSSDACDASSSTATSIVRLPSASSKLISSSPFKSCLDGDDFEMFTLDTVPALLTATSSPSGSSSSSQPLSPLLSRTDFAPFLSSSAAAAVFSALSPSSSSSPFSSFLSASSLSTPLKRLHSTRVTQGSLSQNMQSQRVNGVIDNSLPANAAVRRSHLVLHEELYDGQDDEQEAQIVEKATQESDAHRSNKRRRVDTCSSNLLRGASLPPTSENEKEAAPLLVSSPAVTEKSSGSESQEHAATSSALEPTSTSRKPASAIASSPSFIRASSMPAAGSSPPLKSTLFASALLQRHMVGSSEITIDDRKKQSSLSAMLSSCSPFMASNAISTDCADLSSLWTTSSPSSASLHRSMSKKNGLKLILERADEVDAMEIVPAQRLERSSRASSPLARGTSFNFLGSPASHSSSNSSTATSPSNLRSDVSCSSPLSSCSSSASGVTDFTSTSFSFATTPDASSRTHHQRAHSATVTAKEINGTEECVESIMESLLSSASTSASPSHFAFAPQARLLDLKQPHQAQHMMADCDAC